MYEKNIERVSHAGRFPDRRGWCRAWLASIAMMALLLAGHAATRAEAASGLTSWDATAPSSSLMRWVDRQLVPDLAERLSRHPRFKGESVRLVSLEGEQLNGEIDELTDALRGRLTQQLLSSPGVSLAWTPRGRNAADGSWGATAGAPVCPVQSEVHYLVGIEIATTLDGNHRVSLRALDLQDRTWVPGFAYQWEGRLSREEKRALARRHIDPSLKGHSSAPFLPSERDQLAAYLAERLYCRLGGGVAVYVEKGDQDEETAGLLGLVANYYGSYAGTRLAVAPESAELKLSGRMHPVGDGKAQFWVTAHPVDGETGPVGADVDAYLHWSQTVAAGEKEVAEETVQVVHEVAPEPVLQPAFETRWEPAPEAGMLSAFRLKVPGDRRYCGRGRAAGATFVRAAHDPVAPGECFSLELDVHRDARIFVLRITEESGLVPASRRACMSGNARPVYRAAGSQLRLPLDGEVEPTWRWRGSAGAESYYALAVADATAARKLERFVDELAQSCRRHWNGGGPVNPGDEWLARLDALLARLNTRVDWQAIRVRHGE